MKYQLVESIKNIKDISVVFQQSKGKIGDITTQNNWETIFNKAVKHQLLNPTTNFYGISWDDPEITQQAKVRYDACISISKINASVKSFSTKIIFGGKYLCFYIKEIIKI